MKKKLMFLGAFFVSWLLLTGYGYAAVANVYGISASGIARGNAMTAITKGWSSAYYNMAGLGKTVEKTEKAVGSKKILDEGEVPKEEKKKTGKWAGWGEEVAMCYLYSMTDVQIECDGGVKLRDENNKAYDPDYDIDTLSMGLTTNLRKYFDRPDWELSKMFSSMFFGMAMTFNRDMKMVKLNDLEFRSHNFLLYGREAEGMFVVAGMGFGLYEDSVTMGFGFHMAMTGEGKMKMDDLAIVNEEQSPNASVKMDMGMDLSPMVGFYVDPENFLAHFNVDLGMLKGLELGAKYNHEVYVAFDPFSGTGMMNLLNIELDMYLAMADYYEPTTWSVGMGYTPPFIPIPATLSLDIERQMWSGFFFPGSRILYARRKGIPIPEFQDIWVYRLGFSVGVLDNLTLCAGYFLQPTFVPDSEVEGLYNQLDNDKTVYSCGFEYLLSKIKGMQNPVQINFAVQLQNLDERRALKNTALDAPYTEDLSDTKRTEYRTLTNPSYNYGGSIISFVCEMIIRV